MKLLILTQTVDVQDPVLGFFHRWIEEFARECDVVHVICLKEGVHHLPGNVTVHSLGKPSSAKATQGAGDRMFLRLKYLWRFYRAIWRLRREYTAVFVHMNPEYVVLGGLFWRLWRKRVFLWRNHYQSGFLTDLAAPLCGKVFYTSRFSYTAKFRNAVQMPVGVDLAAFRPDASARVPHSILSLGRIAPSKRVDVFVDALGMMRERGIAFTADIYGSALPQDEAYHAGLKDQAARLGLGEAVRFHPGVKNTDTPAIYAAHDIFVNASRSGMYDKTIFEAAACGAIVVASSEDYASHADPRLVFRDGNAEGLAHALEMLFALSAGDQRGLRDHSVVLAREQSLGFLVERLAVELRA